MGLAANAYGHKNDYLVELDNLVLPKRKNGLGYVSVFCGGGGLDLGFASAGFKPLFSSDIVSTYCDTISNNLPGHLVEPHDITALSGKYLTNKIGCQVDVVLGGPPCQAFSILGDRGSTSDPRGKLVYEYARFISEIKPKSFLFENVPGLLSVNKGRDWSEILQCFEKMTGYHIRWKRLNSVFFGVPQLRQRIVIVGFQEKNNFEWPHPLYAESLEQPEIGLLPPRAAWMALEDVDGLPNHVLREHGERVSIRYSSIPPGGRDKKDHTDRVHPNKPSGTVLVGSGAGGGRPFIHPHEHRHITVREAARLQSFPDWWIFAGGPTASYRQVGNAVPPFMARALAKQIQKALKS